MRFAGKSLGVGGEEQAPMLKALFDCGADWGAEMDHFGNSVITEAQRRCVCVDPCTARMQSCWIWCVASTHAQW